MNSESRYKAVKNHIKKIKKRWYGIKICFLCGKKYVRQNPNQIYCGAEKKKTGCSYEVIKMRWAKTKVNGKRPKVTIRPLTH